MNLSLQNIKSSVVLKSCLIRILLFFIWLVLFLDIKYVIMKSFHRYYQFWLIFSFIFWFWFKWIKRWKCILVKTSLNIRNEHSELFIYSYEKIQQPFYFILSLFLFFYFIANLTSLIPVMKLQAFHIPNYQLFSQLTIIAYQWQDDFVKLSSEGPIFWKKWIYIILKEIYETWM